MTKRRVVMTGAGIVSCIGNDLQTVESALRESRSGISAAPDFAELGLRHREDALDVVQEAMMKMLGYRDRPAEEWSPLFWRILRTRIIDAQRRRRFRLGWMGSATLEDGSEMEWADDNPDPSRSHDSREAWGRMRDAMRALPDRQREAFTLRVLEEFDVAQTAAIMGCSEGSVKTHLSRARSALQTQLEDWR